ncbi:MAG: hypothetical protein WCE21_00275 [Candidatus Babeliales bacterium]
MFSIYILIILSFTSMSMHAALTPPVTVINPQRIPPQKPPVTTQAKQKPPQKLIKGQQKKQRVSLEAKTAGKQLLTAAQKYDATEFTELLEQITNQFKKDKETLFTILDTRTDEGYNILQLFTMTSDIENLEVLFKQLKKAYKKDSKSWFKYISTRDNYSGMNIVSMAQESFNTHVMAFILMRLYEELKDHKDLFFDIMHTPDTKRGWHPLVNAAEGGEQTMILLMITVAAHVFGRTSDQFKKFINTVDKDGDTALDSAHTPRDVLLLEMFGGIRTKKGEDSTYEKIKKIGLNLIDISNRSATNIKGFSAQLNEGLKFCPTDPQLMYYLFNIQDTDGWTPIMQVAADGQYNYLNLLIDGMKGCFIESNKDIKYHIFRLADPEGRSVMHIVIFRKYYNMATKLFDYLMESPFNKPFLFSVVNMPTEFNGFSLLTSGLFIIAGNDTHGVEFISHMLKTVANVFGKDSRMMYLFVNGRDYNNLSPLAYVISANIRKLVRDYGGTDFPMESRAGVDDLEQINNMYIDLAADQFNY